MTDLLRNVFDQYTQAENRLTHALIHALVPSRGLIRNFIEEVAPDFSPPKPFRPSLSCLLLPGDNASGLSDEEEHERRGLPDAWIFDEASLWTMIFECKLTATLTSDQLRRHLRMARNRGFRKVHLLVISADEAIPSAVSELSGSSCSWVSWADVFEFFASRGGEGLGQEFADYLTVTEGRLMSSGYDSGPLTRFIGVPFDGEVHRYTDTEAKVVLRALMRQLRNRLISSKVLKTNVKIRRPALAKPWDVIGLASARQDEVFTMHPHITVGINEEDTVIHLTLPHNAGPAYWAKLQRTSLEQLHNVLESVLGKLRVLRHDLGGGRWEPEVTLELFQRHFHARRKPIYDGRLRFNLDTVVASRKRVNPSVKPIPHWLEAFHQLSKQVQRANFELTLNARFPHVEGGVSKRPEFIDVLAKSAEAFEPFLSLLSA